MLKLSTRQLSSASTFITRIHRDNYLRVYPTKLVLSNGSSVTIRYHEPRQIVKLPLDISALSEIEAKARIDSRRPKMEVIMEEEEITSFNTKRYVNLMKK